MQKDIEFFESETGSGFEAICRGRKVGEITYVRVGIDKLIIDYTGVDPEFRNQQIGLGLVRTVADMARNQKRRVVTICPFARAMFNRYSEFDDIRLMNHH